MPVLNVFDLFKNSAFVKLKSKWTKRYKLLTLLLFWLIQVISVQSVVFYFYTNIMALRTRQGCSILSSNELLEKSIVYARTRGRGGAPESEHVRTEGDRGSKKRCLSAYVFYGCSHDEQKELRNMIRNSYSV